MIKDEAQEGLHVPGIVERSQLVGMPQQVNVIHRHDEQVTVVTLQLDKLFISLQGFLKEGWVAKMWQRHVVVEALLPMRCSSDVIFQFGRDLAAVWTDSVVHDRPRLGRGGGPQTL